MEIVRLFLENCSHLDHTGAGSLTALHLSCLSGQLEVTQALAQRGANIEARDAVSYSPLHIACLYGNETVRTHEYFILDAEKRISLCDGHAVCL